MIKSFEDFKTNIKTANSLMQTDNIKTYAEKLIDYQCPIIIAGKTLTQIFIQTPFNIAFTDSGNKNCVTEKNGFLNITDINNITGTDIDDLYSEYEIYEAHYHDKNPHTNLYDGVSILQNQADYPDAHKFCQDITDSNIWQQIKDGTFRLMSRNYYIKRQSADEDNDTGNSRLQTAIAELNLD